MRMEPNPSGFILQKLNSGVFLIRLIKSFPHLNNTQNTNTNICDIYYSIQNTHNIINILWKSVSFSCTKIPQQQHRIGVYTDISKPWYRDWIDKMLAIDNFTEYIDNENFDPTSVTDPTEDINQSTATTTLTPIDISNTTTTTAIPHDNNGAMRDYAIQRHYLILILFVCIVLFY